MQHFTEYGDDGVCIQHHMHVPARQLIKRPIGCTAQVPRRLCDLAGTARPIAKTRMRAFQRKARGLMAVHVDALQSKEISEASLDLVQTAHEVALPPTTESPETALPALDQRTNAFVFRQCRMQA